MRSLYAKISFAFLALLLLTGVSCAGTWVWVWNRYLASSEQFLHWKTAAIFGAELEGWLSDAPNTPELLNRFRRFKDLNPRGDPYLLDTDGAVILHLSEIKRARISVDPVREFLQNERFPGHAILGEDPQEKRSEATVPFSAAPISIAGKPGYLYLTFLGAGSRNVSSLFGRFDAVRVALLWGSVGLCIVAVLGLLLFHVITRRFRAMTASVKQFAAGDLGMRIATSADDEVGELAGAFNQMATTIRKNIETLKEIDAERRTLVAGVSHDIRGPLTCVKGFLETLELEFRETLSAQAQRSIEIIGSNISHLHRLSDDLFELSKLEATDAAPRSEPFPLDELADEILQRSLLVAEGKGVELNLKGPSERAVVSADPHMIHRVLGNLVDNALRYTDAGGTVSVEITPLPDERRVKVSVRDSGCGIPPEEHERIFGSFYRVDANRSKKIPGSGLGLAIVKRILDLHGTTISVESEPGHGAVFWFTLAAATE